MLVALVLVALAGLRAWAALHGRWWLAAAGTGALLAGYLLALALAGYRVHRRQRLGRQPLPETPEPTIAASVPAEALPLPEPAAKRGSLLRRLRPAPK